MSHDLNRWWANIRGKEDPYSTVGAVNRRDQAADSDYVWALKDINLEVEQGEVLGIIGANGAGKSTLLKLISRITSPTTGSIRAKGRVASLLEVGTGMHPEMTARENIYLNGSILGMRRHEITRKFDDIIDFAGCRMFVDTPVKRFSSGMRVRLGFAVAAFLEPEILIVDEVLAVGDAEFQRRAIAKMQEINNTSGRTILFVSHNMAAIENLCSRGIVLREGGIRFDATATQAVHDYLSRSITRAAEVNLESHTTREGSQRAVLTKVSLRDSQGNLSDSFPCGDSCIVELSYRVAAGESIDPDFGVVISSDMGTRVTRFQTRVVCKQHPRSVACSGTATCVIPNLMLVPGNYQLSLGFATQTGEMLDLLDRVIEFCVTDTDYFGTGRLPNAKGGHAFMNCRWDFAEQVT